MDSDGTGKATLFASSDKETVKMRTLGILGNRYIISTCDFYNNPLVHGTAKILKEAMRVGTAGAHEEDRPSL